MCDKVFDVNAKRWIAPPERSNISLCNARNCLCCKVLNPDCNFTSFSTGCKFVFAKTGNFTCKTKYVIYLIMCLKCGVQYVGQTRQQFHLRMNGHRHSIVNGKLGTFLCKHFSESGHSFADVSVQIIDHVDWQNLSVDEVVNE